jgi:dihydroorotate dehydrogenase electron transfer subunit
LKREAYQECGELLVTTEDGSEGEMGNVTGHSVFKSGRKFDRIYACGPDRMMKAVSHIAAKRGTDCEVSLENFMACGFGVCLCCITPTTHGKPTRLYGRTGVQHKRNLVGSRYNLKI